MADQPAHDIKLPDPVELSRIMTEIAGKSRRLVTDFVARQGGQPGRSNLDPLNIGAAFIEMTARLMTNPAKLVQAQLSLWQDYLSLWQNTARKMFGEPTQPVIRAPGDDRRFRDAMWDESYLFDYIKQSYLLTVRWLRSTVHDVEGLDDKTGRKVDFYTRQFVDAMSPSNFALTNPEVLRATMETGGENLLKGLSNLLDDLDRGKGKVSIRMTDLNAFKVGETIACTPGKVMYQNELMQLIQYNPTTETVWRRPLLVIPPWINKFYILDLRPTNSFVRWCTELGHTVFVVSWINPDEALANKTFEDYLALGPLAALDAIAAATGERTANAVGYCLGGTLLSAALAYLAAKKDKRVASATFLATLVDFAEPGELGVFIDEEQLAHLEDRMNAKGYLPSEDMATTFNMLRSNDLIWSFVVNNYLLGKDPFPFDLLFWNADSTRMPAAMHSFYLRKMYQENLLVKPGGLSMLGRPIDLRKVKIPCYMMSAREDHIAPWRATYAAARIFSGPTRFVLSSSGHIAGVANPPSANKYSYWTNGSVPPSPDDWLAGATQNSGSWWTDWGNWIPAHAGEMVRARVPGSGKLKALEDAPGSYVKVRAS